MRNASGEPDRADYVSLRAAVLIIMITPLLMIAAREIPATLLVIVTLVLGTASWRKGHVSDIGRDLINTLTHPAGCAFAALVVLMLASLVWSPAPARGANHVLHFAAAILLATISIATAIRICLHFDSSMAAFAIFLAAGLLATDIWLFGGLREALFLSTDVFRLNRAAIAITLFLPLATALLAGERRIVLLGMLWVSAIAAVHLSISYSAKLAFIVIVLLLPITIALPHIVHRLATFALPLTVLAMPWIASVANSLVPARLHEAVGYDSLTIRGEIWKETVPFIWQKPFFGWGVEASHALPHLPEAAHLTQVQRDLLGWGHTHNAPLQIWLELGAVGAASTAAALYLGIRALRALPLMLLPYATTTVIAAFAIACVSHGAWQAWWWALLGLIATAYAMAITAHFSDVLRRASESGAKSTG